MSWFNLGASAISALGGLIGGKSQNDSNIQAVRDTNDSNFAIAQMNNHYNERMMQKQMDYNIDMWNRENEYNTAANQAARLRAAGLNPAMVMNGSNAGTAGSAGGVNPPTATPVNMNPALRDNSYIGNSLDKLSQGFIADMQLQNEKARLSIEKKNSDMNALKILAENDFIKSETQGRKILNSYLRHEKDLQLQGMRADNAFKAAQTELALKQGSFQDIQTLIAKQELKNLPHLQQLQLAELSSKIALNFALKNKAKADATNAYASADLSRKNIKLVGEQIKTEAKKRYGIQLSNEQAEDIAPFVIRRAELDALPKGIFEEVQAQMYDSSIQMGIREKPVKQHGVTSTW